MIKGDMRKFLWLEILFLVTTFKNLVNYLFLAVSYF